jgi:hypothetical protein
LSIVRATSSVDTAVRNWPSRPRCMMLAWSQPSTIRTAVVTMAL